MKKSNNKVLIIVGVLLMNVLVLYMIGQTLLGKESPYDIAVREARTYVENELYSRAIDKYNEAVILEDSLELRLEMVDVYEKGMEYGEFTSTYEVFNWLTTMVDIYRDYPAAYEQACKLLMKYQKYEDCAELLMQARDLYVTSEKIEEYREQIRYQYRKNYATYQEVLPVFDGVYVVKADDVYTYLGDDTSSTHSGAYTYASSYSEGYAFVKAFFPDGNERSFLINKDGQRQVYFMDVETSSGVGLARTLEGEELLLLSCKVGDKYKYYHINGKEEFGEYDFAGRFRNNVAAVMESEGKWKLINGTGNPIVDKTFSDVVLNEFDECAPKGLIWAKEGSEYHLYDTLGNQISDFACDGAKAFVDEYAAFQKNGVWGYVDATGQILLTPQFDDAKSFSNRMAAVMIGDGWRLINPKGEIVVQESFDDVDYLNDKGVCFVKSKDKWSYLEMYYTGK
ncbi:MAG: WG repeat-containing protein [Lachnospiraceae bacterium]|nr:WG repeat-containing protein [Lachnospiraceae bacterium]